MCSLCRTRLFKLALSNIPRDVRDEHRYLEHGDGCGFDAFQSVSANDTHALAGPNAHKKALTDGVNPELAELSPQHRHCHTRQFSVVVSWSCPAHLTFGSGLVFMAVFNRVADTLLTLGVRPPAKTVQLRLMVKRLLATPTTARHVGKDPASCPTGCCRRWPVADVFVLKLHSPVEACPFGARKFWG